MPNEVKIVRFDAESLKALKELTATIRISNQVTQSFIDDFLGALRLENVSLLEGGEYEDAGEIEKPPNGL